MWFHASDVRADEWMLYALQSPWSGHGRGFAVGHLFRESSGDLAVTCAQEGVIRLARPGLRTWLAQAWLWASFYYNGGSALVAAAGEARQRESTAVHTRGHGV